MDSVRAALLLLQEHMLFIDHYVPIAKGQRWADLPQVSSAPIIKHIDTYRRSCELQSGQSQAIEQAALQCLRYKGVTPAPVVPFIELVHIFTNHMHVVSAANQISGRYMLQALCFFYRCDKIEAFIRYISPLVQHKVIRNANTNNLRPMLEYKNNKLRVSVSELMRAFEEGTFSANPTTSLPPRLGLSYILPRLTAIYCYTTRREGEPEMLYLSHNLMTFAKLGENISLDPIALGPTLLRRCWLGGSWCLAQYSFSPQSDLPYSNDHCAIVSTDDYHVAIINLCSTNNPGKIPVREWAPVFAAVGFPIHIHPTVIQSIVKQILDVLEMRYGPREQLPYQACDGDSIAFRELCYSMGKTIYDLVSVMVYSPGNAQGDQGVPRMLLSGTHSPLAPLNSSYLSFQLAAGFQRKVSGLPQLSTDFAGFLSPYFAVQSMSPKTLAAASRILLLASNLSSAAQSHMQNAHAQQQQLLQQYHQHQQAISGPASFAASPSSPVGGLGIGVNASTTSAASFSGAPNAASSSPPQLHRLACAIYYHGNLIVSDTHPYIARLMWLAAFAWQSTTARRVAETNAAAAAAAAAAALGGSLNATGNFSATMGSLSGTTSRRSKQTIPLPLPLNHLHPKGPFAEHALRPKPSFYSDGTAPSSSSGGGGHSSGSPVSSAPINVPIRPSVAPPIGGGSDRSSHGQGGAYTGSSGGGGGHHGGGGFIAGGGHTAINDYFSFSGALQGVGTMRHCSQLEMYLTLQDAALLWYAGKGTNAQNTTGTGNRLPAPPPEGWHPAVQLSNNGIEIIILYQSDPASAHNNHNRASSNTTTYRNSSTAGGGVPSASTSYNPRNSALLSNNGGGGGAASRSEGLVGTPTTANGGGGASTPPPSPTTTPPLSASGQPQQLPPSSAVRSAVHTALQRFAAPIVEEMIVLRHSIVKNDVVRKPKPIQTINGGTKQRKLPDTVGYVHNKATGSSTFLEGTSGAGGGGSGVTMSTTDANAAFNGVNVLGEGPAAESFTAANIQRSNQLVSEAASVARLLGAKMHNKPSNYFTQSLGSKPITRVILGRSAFGDYGDRSGTFNVVYGKETAGQQVVVGTATTITNATLRNAEEQYLLFAGACAKNNIPIV